MKMTYDKGMDILRIRFKGPSPENFWRSVELPSGAVIDIAQDGTISAFEIFRASKIFTGDLKKVLATAEQLGPAKLTA